MSRTEIVKYVLVERRTADDLSETVNGMLDEWDVYGSPTISRDPECRAGITYAQAMVIREYVG